MLVSHRKKFIYLKTAKTAGTSIESYFEKFCLPENEWTFSHTRDENICEAGIIGYRGESPRGKRWYNHMSAMQIKSQIDDSIWRTYFKFCVIRNPFDLLISGFHMFEKIKEDYTNIQRVKKAAKWLLRRSNPIDLVYGINKIDRFRSWIRMGGWIDNRDKYFLEETICMDFFIRYEDLQNGIKQVCDRLCIPFEPEKIPRLKSDYRVNDFPISEYYDTNTIELVEKRYKFELEYFGYELPKHESDIA